MSTPSYASDPDKRLTVAPVYSPETTVDRRNCRSVKKKCNPPLPRLTRDFAAVATAPFDRRVQKVREVAPGLAFTKYAHVDHCCFSSGWNDRLTG